MKKIKSIIMVIVAFTTLLFGCGKAQVDSRILWKYSIAGNTYTYYSSAILSEDEQTIYFGTSLKVALPQSESDRLIALNRNGSLKWEYYTNGGEIRSNPIVVNGSIYFIADFGRTVESYREKAELIAVNQNGEFAWSQQVASSGLTAGGLYDLISINNNILVVTSKLNLFDADSGELIYESEILQGEGMTHSYPRPILKNNIAYFFLKNRIYEFDTTINNLTYTDIVGLPANTYNSPVQGALRLDSENNFYFGYNSYYISLNEDKTVRWIFDIEDTNHNFRSSAYINEIDNVLYVGTKANEKSKLIALNLDNGTFLWSYHVGQDVYSSPILFEDKIYFGSEARKLHIMTKNGEMLSEIELHQDITWSSPKIDSNGILYIGGMREYIYAIKTR